MLHATLEAPGASIPVVLCNLSQDGALVRGSDLPEPGERVVFHRQGLSAPSRIAWLYRQHAGVAFDSPLFPGELMRHVPPPAAAKPPPEIKRRPGVGPQPLTRAERMLIERWAAESSYTLGD